MKKNSDKRVVEESQKTEEERILEKMAKYKRLRQYFALNKNPKSIVAICRIIRIHERKKEYVETDKKIIFNTRVALSRICPFYSLIISPKESTLPPFSRTLADLEDIEKRDDFKDRVIPIIFKDGFYIDLKFEDSLKFLAFSKILSEVCQIRNNLFEPYGTKKFAYDPPKEQKSTSRILSAPSNISSGLNTISGSFQKSDYDIHNKRAYGWNYCDIDDWLSLIFITDEMDRKKLKLKNEEFNENLMSRLDYVTVKQYLMKRNCFDAFKNLFKEFENTLTIDVLLQKIERFEKININLKEEDDLMKRLENVFYDDKLRNTLKREIRFIKLENNGFFNIDFALIFKKFLKKRELEFHKNCKASVGDYFHLLKSCDWIWDIEACRNHLLSLIFYGVSFKSFVASKVNEFEKLEKEMFGNTSSKGRILDYGEFKIYKKKGLSPNLWKCAIPPEEWQSMLHKFEVKIGIKLGEFSQAMKSKLKQNKFRKKRVKRIMNLENFDKYEAIGKAKFEQIKGRKMRKVKKPVEKLGFRYRNPKLLKFYEERLKEEMEDRKELIEKMKDHEIGKDFKCTKKLDNTIQHLKTLEDEDVILKFEIKDVIDDEFDLDEPLPEKYKNLDLNIDIDEEKEIAFINNKILTSNSKPIVVRKKLISQHFTKLLEELCSLKMMECQVRFVVGVKLKKTFEEKTCMGCYISIGGVDLYWGEDGFFKIQSRRTCKNDLFDEKIIALDAECPLIGSNGGFNVRILKLAEEIIKFHVNHEFCEWEESEIPKNQSLRKICNSREVAFNLLKSSLDYVPFYEETMRYVGQLRTVVDNQKANIIRFIKPNKKFVKCFEHIWKKEVPPTSTNVNLKPKSGKFGFENHKQLSEFMIYYGKTNDIYEKFPDYYQLIEGFDAAFRMIYARVRGNRNANTTLLKISEPLKGDSYKIMYFEKDPYFDSNSLARELKKLNEEEVEGEYVD